MGGPWTNSLKISSEITPSLCISTRIDLYSRAISSGLYRELLSLLLRDRYGLSLVFLLDDVSLLLRLVLSFLLVVLPRRNWLDCLAELRALGLLSGELDFLPSSPIVTYPLSLSSCCFFLGHTGSSILLPLRVNFMFFLTFLATGGSWISVGSSSSSNAGEELLEMGGLSFPDVGVSSETNIAFSLFFSSHSEVTSALDGLLARCGMVVFLLPMFLLIACKVLFKNSSDGFIMC